MLVQLRVRVTSVRASVCFTAKALRRKGIVKIPRENFASLRLCGPDDYRDAHTHTPCALI